MIEQTRPRVLVLDGHLRHSLAIVRNLGRRGIPVVAASSKSHFPARYSRYVEASVTTMPGADPLALQTLKTIIQRESIEVVIPAGLSGYELLCRYREALEPLVRAPFNDLSQFERLSNKRLTIELAEALGVAYPKTAELAGPDQADEVAGQIGFPMVFKSPVDQGTVRYPRDVRELRGLVAEFAEQHPRLIRRGILPLAQEYVAGDAHGFYALADRGDIRAYFMHRRLHEVPPTGGPSAMAMSFRDPALLEVGSRFFAATKWNGVAMVEFKRARDGRYVLIEVNPKFWGSLDLSIAAGVDFPLLLYAMLAGEQPLEVELGAYRDGVIFRWLTMDLAHAVATHRLRTYLRSFADDRINDDFDVSDPLPTAVLFWSGVVRTAGRTTAPQSRDGHRHSPSDSVANAVALRAFYAAKPLIPRTAQVAARRIRARWIWNRVGRDGTGRIPLEPVAYPWPDNSRACVLLTHDIETAEGQRHVAELCDIEAAYGVRSCWNFVVRRYPVDTALIAQLQGAGHEVGLHGVYHDGKEFESPSRFRERLAVMEETGRAWGAVGFRSPSLLYDRELLSTLPFEWDSSMPAWDPFQPKPGDCHSYVPFLLNSHCVELPVTVWQDFTLFEELQMAHIDVWRQQVDRIYAIGGLITVIAHPDYMTGRVELYRALLEHLAEKDGVWIATPSQVAEWERTRARS